MSGAVAERWRVRAGGAQEAEAPREGNRNAESSPRTKSWARHGEGKEGTRYRKQGEKQRVRRGEGRKQNGRKKQTKRKDEGGELSA